MVYIHIYTMHESKMSSLSLEPVPLPPPVPPDLFFLQPLESPLSLPPPTSTFLDSIQISSPVNTLTSPSDGSKSKVASSKPSLTDLWVEKAKASFQPLSKVASPTFDEEGIPSVIAPDSITLGTSILWKDHLVAYFHGTPPSIAKIFQDLNPIWGRNGQIKVKQYSSRICMIFVPCLVTRQWALDVGFWYSGNCSFTLALWEPSLSMTPTKLTHAPLWVLFRKVPPELWSIDGFSTIASGVGTPVHSEFSSIKPYTNGIIKLKVIVELGKKRSNTVKVTDKFGTSVQVTAEFPKLPPKCNKCGEFGHLVLRCPNLSAFAQSENLVQRETLKEPPSTTIAKGSKAIPKEVVSDGEVVAGSPVQQPVLPRAQSLPISKDIIEADSSSGGWIRVVKRSKVKRASTFVSSPKLHLTKFPNSSSKFLEEENLIKTAQRIIRNRLDNLESNSPRPKTTAARRYARKHQRQKQLLLSCSEPGRMSSSTLIPPFGPATDEHELKGSVQSLVA